MSFSSAKEDRCRRSMLRQPTKGCGPEGAGRVHLELQYTPPSSAWDDVQINSRDVAQPGRAHPWGG